LTETFGYVIIINNRKEMIMEQIVVGIVFGICVISVLCSVFMLGFLGIESTKEVLWEIFRS